MNLDSPEFKKLINLIKDSFRVRYNQKTLYIDVGSNLDRIGSAQHQIIFGRRGSGKSCLLVHYLTNARPQTVVPIYIMADEFKRLTYPDILIRLLIELLEALPVRARWIKRLFRRNIPTLACAKELRQLLDLAEESEVVQDRKRSSRRSATAQISSSGLAEIGASNAVDSVDGRTSSSQGEKN